MKLQIFEVSKPDVQQQLKIKDAIPKYHLTEEAKSEIQKIKEVEKNGKQRRIKL